MKKNIFTVFLVVILLLILGSCVTPITFDENLSENEYALIHWNTPLAVTQFNDIAVNWKAEAMIFSSLELKIPGGNSHFVLNGTVGSHNMGYTTYRDIPFVFNFENGKEYTLLVGQQFIYIYRGKSSSNKDHIVTYNMYNGQKAIYENGKKVQ
jgi:hypothetical protein